jgi:hypothetical protein
VAVAARLTTAVRSAAQPAMPDSEYPVYLFFSVFYIKISADALKKIEFLRKMKKNRHVVHIV